MARSQASNLSGMLGSIGDTLGKMGDVGNQYVDTFRRSLAPKADMNDSASLLAYADWARRNGYDDEARQYLTLGETQRRRENEEAKAGRLQMGRSSVASLQNEYMRVLKDPTLSAKDRDAKLANLQASMNAIAGAVDGMDPVRVGQIGQQSEAADLARRDREQAMDLRQQANERAWASFDLQEEAAARAQEQHEEWVATAEYRATERQIKANEGRYNEGVRLAKSLAGTEGGKEKFLSNPKYADMEGVWNAVSRQVEQQQIELDEARRRAEQGKWTYTDEQLLELGISESAVAAIQRAGQERPELGHKAVERVLMSQFETAEMPTGAMLGLFKDAALTHITQKKVNVAPGKDSQEELEAAAGKLALAMARRYMETGGSIEEALKEATAYNVGMEAKQTGEEDSDAAIVRQVMAEAIAAQQDAADPDQ